MSRAYRISVSESTRKHLRVDDGIQTHLELLPVLDGNAMAELLAGELAGLGFERDGEVMKKTVEVAGKDGRLASAGAGKASTRDNDGRQSAPVEVSIDLRSGAVTARLSLETDVDARVTVTRVADRDDPEAARGLAREQARRQLDDQIEAGRRKLTGEVAGRLEQALRDLRGDLDRAANRVAAEALKTRARQLGEVQEISENPETGELVIRVRV